MSSQENICVDHIQQGKKLYCTNNALVFTKKKKKKKNE